jgi:hypothetical protein
MTNQVCGNRNFQACHFRKYFKQSHNSDEIEKSKDDNATKKRPSYNHGRPNVPESGVKETSIVLIVANSLFKKDDDNATHAWEAPHHIPGPLINLMRVMPN